MKPFIYRKAVKISTWGCSFDSLLELKYAIAISDEYEFLRSHIPVYYDPATLLPVTYIRGNTKRYTPDFLIRHKITREAFWVELKPAAYTDIKQLEIRRTVAENYIRERNFDWKFRIVRDTDIHLNENQKKVFDQKAGLAATTRRKYIFDWYNKKVDRSAPNLMFVAPSNKRVRFVMLGSSFPSTVVLKKG